jgi:uncharacterized protein YceK
MVARITLRQDAREARSRTEEEPAMRIWMRFIAMLIIPPLAGCAAAVTASAPRPGTAVAFNANTDAEFEEAAQRAKEWCAETYDEPAKYLDSRTDASGKVVRFGCVPK